MSKIVVLAEGGGNAVINLAVYIILFVSFTGALPTNCHSKVIVELARCLIDDKPAHRPEKAI